ncbi:MAG: ATP-binding protein [Bacteroidota bacterium]
MRTLPLLVVVGAAVLAADGVAAQAHERGRPFIQAWSPKVYGAHPTNWAVAQGNDGLLYVGNGTHLLAYDGVRWDRFAIAEQGTIRALTPRPGGDGFFVGSVGDFGVLRPADDGTLAYTSLRDRVPARHRDFSIVWNAIPTRAGKVFQTSDRLFRLEGDADAPDRLTVFGRTASDRYGTLFALHDRLVIRDRTQGLAWVEDTTLVPIADSERFQEASLYGLVPRGERTLLLSVDEGLLECDLSPGAPLSCIPFNAATNALLVPAWPYRVQPLADGRLAVATITNGVALLGPDGALERWLTQDDGLPNNAVTALGLDADGGLWIATQNGIARAEVATRLTQFDARDGLAGTPSYFARHGGVLYVSTVEGVFALRPGTPAPGSTLPPEPASPRFEAVLNAPDQCWRFAVHEGALYVGCSRGVHRLDGPPSTARFAPTRWFDAAEVFAFDLVFSQHAPGLAFVATDFGLRRARLTTATAADLLDDASISSLYEAPVVRGDTLTLWAGSWNGARRFRLSRTTGALLDAAAFGLVVGGSLLVSQRRMRLLTLQNERLEAAVAVRTEEIREKNAALETANTALKEANVELHDALEQNKEFLGIAAHDLKNPLGGIAGMADMLLSTRDEMTRAEQAESLSIIRSEAVRAVDIITDVLEDARREATLSRPHVDCCRVDLAEIARAVVRWNRTQASRKDIKLDTDVPERLPAHVDVSAVQRAMDNLVSNAVKYSKPGGRVWVALTVDKQDDGGDTAPERWARFAVRDEGPGLTEDDKAKAFGKLERLSAQPTGGEHSTGLGLYIVRGLVAAHGGDVGVESTYGQGATFWLRLSLEPEYAPA